MADHFERVTETRESTDNPANLSGRQSQNERFVTVATNIVNYFAGLLLVLLAFRFFFALSNANPSNWLTSFIYDLSHPFVSPFFNIFNYRTEVGGSRLELYTIVAMIIYAVIAYGITTLLAISSKKSD